MSQGTVVTCRACGRKNRLVYARFGTEARCGFCKAALPPPAEPLALDRAGDLAAAIHESAIPVLVDFWAPWCGPCRAVAPEIAKVAERNAGRLLVVKVNTEIDPAVGQAHRISSIPTMALFSGGRELTRTSGARPAEAIEAFVRQALAGAA